MNRRRDLVLILIFQILTIPTVIFLFKYLDRKIAAISASAVFISYGVFALWKICKWPNFRRELLFWLLAVQLFLITLPIFFTRVMNWDSSFDQLTTFGLQATTFHSLSQYFGIAVTAVIVWMLWKKRQ